MPRRRRKDSETLRVLPLGPVECPAGDFVQQLTRDMLAASRYIYINKQNLGALLKKKAEELGHSDWEDFTSEGGRETVKAVLQTLIPVERREDPQQYIALSSLLHQGALMSHLVQALDRRLIANQLNFTQQHRSASSQVKLFEIHTNETGFSFESNIVFNSDVKKQFADEEDSPVFRAGDELRPLLCIKASYEVDMRADKPQVSLLSEDLSTGNLAFSQFLREDYAKQRQEQGKLKTLLRSNSAKENELGEDSQEHPNVAKARS